jgi:hypothetical protein
MSGTHADEAARRRAIGVGRKISLRDDDGSFDIDFWDRYTPSERMMLVWTMVQEEHAARGGDPAALQFQRNVGGLRPRSLKIDVRSKPPRRANANDAVRSRMPDNPTPIANALNVHDSQP